METYNYEQSAVSCPQTVQETACAPQQAAGQNPAASGSQMSQASQNIRTPQLGRTSGEAGSDGQSAFAMSAPEKHGSGGAGGSVFCPGPLLLGACQPRLWSHRSGYSIASLQFRKQLRFLRSRTGNYPGASGNNPLALGRFSAYRHAVLCLPCPLLQRSLHPGTS